MSQQHFPTGITYLFFVSATHLPTVRSNRLPVSVINIDGSKSVDFATNRVVDVHPNLSSCDGIFSLGLFIGKTYRELNRRCIRHGWQKRALHTRNSYHGRRVEMNKHNTCNINVNETLRLH